VAGRVQYDGGHYDLELEQPANFSVVVNF
jgi:hypothetical protein